MKSCLVLPLKVDRETLKKHPVIRFAKKGELAHIFSREI